ncbi:hypothetical protein [Staphylococcus chromogenes]|nr:hypothetical protein [Staphylococcus chromogenes]
MNTIKGELATSIKGILDKMSAVDEIKNIVEVQELHRNFSIQYKI